MGITRYVRRRQLSGSDPGRMAQIPDVDRIEAPEVTIEAQFNESAPAVVVEHQPVVGNWQQLSSRVQTCTDCGLHRTRTQTVFGVGAENADLLIIGEAPGAEEDKQGEPFVGAAGQLLNAMLHAIGLQRKQVYIANIVKCRPPGNRNPANDEAAACRKHLDHQVELIQPRVILSVGAVSAHNLLLTTDSVARLRHRPHRYGKRSIPLVVTYHPAYLLRYPAEKAKVWLDLQKLAQLML